MADFLRKNEIAQILGIPKSTIRYYEQVGLIHPLIDDNQYRQYKIEDLKKLSQIHFMRDLDFDIDTIKLILENESSHTGELLKQKKNDIRKTIVALQDQLEYIDKILSISESEPEPLSFKISHFPDRYLYALDPNTKDLGNLHRENRSFFVGHNLHIGGWFINLIDTQVLLNSNTTTTYPFTECIQVTKIKESSKYRDAFTLAPSGSYLCVNLVLDEKSKLDWYEIGQKIDHHIKTEKLTLKDGHILVLNYDNLNFNFGETVRILNIQVPIM